MKSRIKFLIQSTDTVVLSSTCCLFSAFNVFFPYLSGRYAGLEPASEGIRKANYAMVSNEMPGHNRDSSPGLALGLSGGNYEKFVLDDTNKPCQDITAFSKGTPRRETGPKWLNLFEAGPNAALPGSSPFKATGSGERSRAGERS